MRALAATAAALVVAGCSGGEQGKTVVASFYPLAYAAERIAGPDWRVIDLTPPGTEAHDVELSLEDRTAIEKADLVIYLGDIGFQPQVEAAVDEAGGRVVTVGGSGIHHPPPANPDPHVWLDPVIFADMAATIGRALHEVQRAAELQADLETLDRRFRRGLADCRYRTMIVPHEAFAYLGGRYNIRQFGLTGITPEGEATAERLAEAHRLIEDGEAGAVFYEVGGESQRAGENLANDAGVPALPLSTLESQPPSGDYLSVMEDNLDSLREGLGCE
jgi:zinc transport system substrate-binding protein